jgi:hypothetical protein
MSKNSKEIARENGAKAAGSKTAVAFFVNFP